jgi:quercetin dioxygenase-like cupin family protein
MSIAVSFSLAPARPGARPGPLAIVGGLACALAATLVISMLAPVARDALFELAAPLCANAADATGTPLNKVEPIASYPLPNVPGKRVTIVRVFYGPGGFTRAHRHAGSVTAYITKGEIRSQLGGGPLETFKVGQSFFEPPGSTHLVSANASTTEPAELIAVFVADEGAQLTTYLE